MIRQHKLFSKQPNQLAKSLILAISIVVVTAQEVLAIPLEPILNQKAILLLEELLGIDSNNQAAPSVNQPWTNTQQKTNFPSAYPTCSAPNYAPTYSQGHTGCTPNFPVPTYIPMYPQGYPGYLPGSPQVSPGFAAPTYVPIYPQGYPGYLPGSPQVSPGFAAPTYVPIYPQVSPGFPVPTYIPMYP
ncbi:hypothetical protein A6770_28195 [Nostoc minutum NIES-26]|uniref:Uncharacterized protein n=1 Tax=Nostoc minutum NIES-26 TaxID=1844469 RepID=A0A367QLX2_9NOSO|nr:hypothetical protein A6770_28195 [Nostoc minutum NIES-26]